MIIENIKDILEKETKDLIEGLENKIEEDSKRLYDLENQYYDSQSKNAMLLLQLEEYKAKDNSINTIKSMLKVEDENILDILPLLGFVPVDKTRSGMNEPPLWFVLLVKFYNEKERLFKVLDIFDISYPKYAKNIKMPYEYNEEELDVLFDNMNNLFVCNGEMLDNNLGFWYNEGKQFLFDAKKLLKNNYSEIPWQFILKNPLLLTKKYFDKIIFCLNKDSNSDMFYHLCWYQELNKDQINRLAKKLLERKEKWYQQHTRFIEHNLAKIDNEVILDMMFEKVAPDDYGVFSWKKFPKSYQVRFIKNQIGLQKQIEKVFSSKLTEEEKVELIAELTKLARK